MDHRFPDNTLHDSWFIKLSDGTFVPMVKIGNTNIQTKKGTPSWTIRSIHWFDGGEKLSYTREEIFDWLNAKYEVAVKKWRENEEIHWDKAKWYMGFYMYCSFPKVNSWFDRYRLFFEDAINKAVEIKDFALDPVPSLHHGLRVCYLDNDDYDGIEYGQASDKLKTAKMFISVDTEKDLRFVWNYAKTEMKLRYTWLIPGWWGKPTYQFPQSVLTEYPHLRYKEGYLF